MQNKLPLMGFLCPHAHFCRSLQNFNLVLNAKVSFDVSQSNITPITARANIELNVLARRWRERHLETQLCFVVLSLSSPPRSAELRRGASEIRALAGGFPEWLNVGGGGQRSLWGGTRGGFLSHLLFTSTNRLLCCKWSPANTTQSSSLAQNINPTSGEMTVPIKIRPPPTSLALTTSMCGWVTWLCPPSVTVWPPNT